MSSWMQNAGVERGDNKAIRKLNKMTAITLCAAHYKTISVTAQFVGKPINSHYYYGVHKTTSHYHCHFHSNDRLSWRIITLFQRCCTKIMTDMNTCRCLCPGTTTMIIVIFTNPSIVIPVILPIILLRKMNTVT